MEQYLSAVVEKYPYGVFADRSQSIDVIFGGEKLMLCDQTACRQLKLQNASISCAGDVHSIPNPGCIMCKSAHKCSGHFIDFCPMLLASEVVKKLVIVACMRKLCHFCIVKMNACECLPGAYADPASDRACHNVCLQELLNNSA